MPGREPPDLQLAPSGGRSPEIASSQGRPRVLVVDDNPDVCRDIQRVLSRSQEPERMTEIRAKLFGDVVSKKPGIEFAVDIALQGRDAVERVKAAMSEDRPYALAFVDMRMPPGWTGVETIAHLWEVDPQIAVVIYTAYSDFRWDEVIQQLGRSEGLHLLRKPLHPQQLVRVAEVLTTKWLRERGWRAA